MNEQGEEGSCDGAPAASQMTVLCTLPPCGSILNKL